ncbi:TetR/AcrR family transcriptional regulator [Nocardia sp. NPDC058499]|uniref:TetR/AcrR family transcriptional regulator n=1 Tax=Nocardia sp. NPDC058499 TaxID=3346530 RepID=UPI003665E8A5
MAGSVDWLAGGDRRTIAVDRIERAAMALFLEQGIDKVTVDGIAAAAGCSRATLYRYCGGKTQLVHSVLAKAAATVAERVAAAIEPFQGSRRLVEAVLAAVAAIRADPTLAQWLTRHRSAATDELLSTAPELGKIASTLTRIAPDAEAAQWIVRIVLALLSWPLPDSTAERRMVERFVAPAPVNR